MIRRCLVAAAAAAALLTPTPAAYADSPVALRGVVVSTSNAAITPTACTTTTRVGVYYTDPTRQGPPAGSGITVTNAAAGSTAGIVSSTTSWRNGVSSVTYVLRLCGLDTAYPATEPGWYRVAVRLGSQGQLIPRAGFTLRYQGLVRLNASPEPVRRGGTVTLTASVSDGWEYSDPHPLRIYFRRAGTPAWRYFGVATPRCVEMCDEGESFTRRPAASGRPCRAPGRRCRHGPRTWSPAAAPTPSPSAADQRSRRG